MGRHENYHADWRRARVAAGFCSEQCGRPARDGMKTCGECGQPREQRNAYRREMSRRWIAAGLCRNCGARPHKPERTQCANCLKNSRDGTRRQRAKKPDAERLNYQAAKAAGICVHCRVPGKPLERDILLCAGCNNAERERAVRMKQAVMDKYGGACVCCGERKVAFLTIDHANDDGQELRKAKIHRGGRSFYRWLLRRPIDPTLRVMCWNCNLGRRATGVCPHVDNSFYEMATERGKYERREHAASRVTTREGTGDDGRWNTQRPCDSAGGERRDDRDQPV
jgi:hypothetical protein